jgi:hypothetical protein
MSVSPNHRMVIHWFLGKKETHETITKSVYSLILAENCSVRTWCQVLMREAFSSDEVLWCEWHDHGTGKSIRIFSHDGDNCLLKDNPESAAVMDMQLRDVLSIDAALGTWNGHVELRVWRGQKWKYDDCEKE